jgi:cobalt-zinc-cadmium efflux system membrane fusion protein
MKTLSQTQYSRILFKRTSRLWISLLALSLSSLSYGQSDHDEHDHAEEADHGENHEEHSSHDEHGDEEHGHEEGPIRLTPEIRREFDIVVGPVGEGSLHEEVILPGEIRFNREEVAYATPRFAGTILEIKVRLADKVTKGEVLATLESTETLRPFEIRAPFDGTVVAYELTPGQTVEAGAALFTIVDLSTVWADLRIYQRSLGQIQEDQSVFVEGGHGLGSYRGTISYIAPTVDEHTRTGLARVLVDNTEGVWKPGQFIKGAVSIEEHTVEVLVPRSAILTMEGSNVVFVETEEGFEPRSVTLGHSDAESYEVVRGLEPGERIVLRNAISLKAEMSKGAFGGHQH